MNFNLGTIFFCVILSTSECLSVLGVFPINIKSHFHVFQSLMKEMSRRGHDVTVVSHYPLEEPLPRYRDVSLKGILPLFVETVDVEALYNYNRKDMYIAPTELSQWGQAICESTYFSGRLNEILNTTIPYDLIVVEMFNTDCFLPISFKFKAPIVAISSSTLLPWVISRSGIPLNPSYMQSVFMGYPKNLDFLERFENSMITWIHLLFYRFWRNKKDDSIVRRYLNESMLPSVTELARSTSLIFVNTHFTLHDAKPLPPNVVEIGGIHLEKKKKLPENIEKFINESTHGVIYFSLGSMIKGHTFPQEKREAFLKAFARLPQRVLWKWENETMPGKPDNVMIQKWMPQFDILSHPNVKAFISHGGLLGTTEAVHCGVPMVVMPQYGDQHTNAKAVEANGGGVVLYLKEATEETVYQSLKTILEPEFRAKAKALSERFRDRPMSPMDTAIYWVEYVARHKGAPHMKTAAVDMPLYQYLLLDVLAFLAAIILLFSYISYKILSLVFRSVFAKKKVKQN
ncbi:UDP-glycosyltransferase UGT5-like isoform X4 [Coccinella septempunctata]|uniref:UDP-glycosyltransferase UGT5-like isoform X4 n=1 Tax=Coccinella septempunctata TaxID=41139 RepID=UPI001D05E99B|nr:UDP-glycosyltransferase UGT5-like isoform X4 [Coccinella septempunctata]